MSAAVGLPAQGAGLGTSGNVIPSAAGGELGTVIPRLGSTGRFELRDAMREFWWRHGVDEFRTRRLCGVTAIRLPDAPASVQLRMDRDGARAAVTGTTSCGDTRLCPVCAPRVLRKRREEIRDLTATAFAQGMRVAFVTGTLRHRRDQGPAQQRKAIENGWRSVTQGGAMQRAKKAGLVGTIRGFEVQLLGPAGPHAHVHALVFFAPGTDDDTIGAFMDGAGGRWRASAERDMDGLRPSEAHGWQWELVDDAAAAGDYVTKGAADELGWSPADEIARADLKRGRNGSISPLQLVQLVAGGDYDPALEALLVDFARAMKGARTILVSRSLREALGAPDERTDEELAAEAEDVRDWPIVAEFSPTAWALIVREVGVAGAMRAAVEMRGACVPYLLERAEEGRRRRAA